MSERVQPVVVIDNFDRERDPTGTISSALLGPWTDIYYYAGAGNAREDFPTAVHRDELDDGDPINVPIIWPIAKRGGSDGL